MDITYLNQRTITPIHERPHCGMRFLSESHPVQESGWLDFDARCLSEQLGRTADSGQSPSRPAARLVLSPELSCSHVFSSGRPSLQDWVSLGRLT